FNPGMCDAPIASDRFAITCLLCGSAAACLSRLELAVSRFPISRAGQNDLRAIFGALLFVLRVDRGVLVFVFDLEGPSVPSGSPYVKTGQGESKVASRRGSGIEMLVELALLGRQDAAVFPFDFASLLAFEPQEGIALA